MNWTAVRQQRALNRIEKTLLADDLHLGSLFAIFTRLARYDAMPGTERTRAGPGRLLRTAVLAATGLFFLTALLLTLLVPGRQACPGTAISRPASSQPPAGLMAGCRPGTAARRTLARP